MITRKSVFQLFMAFSLACGGLGAVSVLNAPEAAAANTCGTSYRMVKDGRVPVKDASGERFATIEVYFSSKDNQNCAILVKEGRHWGLEENVNVSIAFAGDQDRQQGQDTDSGRMKEYSRAVYTAKGVAAGDKPIKVSATVGNASASAEGWDGSGNAPRITNPK